MSEPNITFLTRAEHGFQGARVFFRRMGVPFVRYFSELEYGSAEAARKAAEEVRDAIARALDETSEPPETVFARYRKPSPGLPPGMHPLQKRLSDEAAPASFTIRNIGLLASEANTLCARFGVDRSSALRLIGYAGLMLLRQEGFKGLALGRTIEKLESGRAPGAPSWEEYVQGKPDGLKPQPPAEDPITGG